MPNLAEMREKINITRESVVNDLLSQGLNPDEIEKLLLSEKNSDWSSEEIRSYTHLGSFTDVPKLKGQTDPSTGKKWVYTPDLPWWRDYKKELITRPEITMGEDRTIIEAPGFGYTGDIKALPKAREMMARDEEMIAAGERRKELEAPQKRSAIPDRVTYIKEFVLPRLRGVNPYTVNFAQKADQLYRKNVDKAFKQVFPKIPIGGMLTGEQQKHWAKINEQLRQHYYNWYKGENDFQKDLYGHMMSEYEKQKAEIEAKEKERISIEEKAGELERAEAKLRMQKRVAREFKEPKVEKPEYKPGQALEKIASAQKAKATFDKTKQMDVVMAGLFPEFKSLIGKKLSHLQIATVNRSYDRLIDYLEKFAPKTKALRDQAIEQLQNDGKAITEANIIWMMDKL